MDEQDDFLKQRWPDGRWQPISYGRILRQMTETATIWLEDTLEEWPDREDQEIADQLAENFALAYGMYVTTKGGFDVADEVESNDDCKTLAEEAVRRARVATAGVAHG